MKTIVFTGGGTAGHVTPNLALIEKLQNENIRCVYMGSNDGIEKKIVTQKNIEFIDVKSGKLRRYFSFKTMIDPFKIMYGILQSYFYLGKIKPNVIFSKGGFVSFPVVVAAYFKKIPVIIHESDMTPGLANKLSFPFATTICVTFPETKQFIKNQKKIVVAGTPIRNEFFTADKDKGLSFCGFTNEKPLLLIIGGSAGSEILNQTVRNSLDEILKNYYVCHLCGVGKVDKNIMQPCYVQFEYLNQEIFDVMAAAEVVLSRAGANTLLELIAIKKLHILVPLSKKASRGDQIDNAIYFKNKGISEVIFEEDFSKQTLLQSLQKIALEKDQLKKAREAYNYQSGNFVIDQLLQTYLE